MTAQAVEGWTEYLRGADCTCARRGEQWTQIVAKALVEKDYLEPSDLVGVEDVTAMSLDEAKLAVVRRAIHRVSALEKNEGGQASEVTALKDQLAAVANAVVSKPKEAAKVKVDVWGPAESRLFRWVKA